MGISTKFNKEELSRRVKWMISGPVLPHDAVTYDDLAHFNPENVPKDWDFIDYAPGGINTGCIRAKARNDDPSHKITFFSGFKANTEVFNKPRIRALQYSGVEIDIVLLPDPGKHVGYLHDNKRIIADTLVHNPPPGALKDGIPHYIFGHSLGGRGVLSNMLDDDFATQVNDTYDGFVGIAPHFTSPYRSKMLTNGIFSVYCKLFPDRSYGEAPLDWMRPAVEEFTELIRRNYRQVRRLAEEKKASAYEPTTTGNTKITYGQIYYSNLEGENLHRRIEEDGVPDAAREFPMIFMAGKHDFVSSPKYVESIANAFGGAYFEFDAFHHPLLEAREARALAVAAMQMDADDWKFDLPKMFPHSFRAPQKNDTTPDDIDMDDNEGMPPIPPDGEALAL